MQRPTKGVGPSAPMYDDGGQLDPITLLGAGTRVTIRGGREYGEFCVVGHGAGGHLTIVAKVVSVGGMFAQQPLPVFSCSLEPIVPPVPAVPVGALDTSKADPKPAEPAAVAGRVSHLKLAEPSANGVKAPKAPRKPKPKPAPAK